jgi:hypothetical protein
MATDESHSKVEFKKVFLFFRFSDSDNKKVNFWIQKSLFKQFQQVSRYTNTKKLFYSKKEKMEFFFNSKDKRAEFCAQLDIFSQIIAAWTLISEMFPSHSMFLCIF